MSFIILRHQHCPPCGGCIQGDHLVRLHSGPNYAMGITPWGLPLARGGRCNGGLGGGSWEARHMGYNQNYTAQHAQPTYAHARCPITGPLQSHHDKTKQNGMSRPMSPSPLHISPSLENRSAHVTPKAQYLPMHLWLNAHSTIL